MAVWSDIQSVLTWKKWFRKCQLKKELGQIVKRLARKRVGSVQVSLQNLWYDTVLVSEKAETSTLREDPRWSRDVSLQQCGKDQTSNTELAPVAGTAK